MSGGSMNYLYSQIEYMRWPTLSVRCAKRWWLMAGERRDTRRR